MLGVAPSLELMREQLERERILEERGFPVAETGASGAVPAFAAAGLRTIPPRENGGNLDIRHLVVGSRLFLPVHVQERCSRREICISPKATARSVAPRSKSQAR